DPGSLPHLTTRLSSDLGPDAANDCRTALSLMITLSRPAVNGTRTKNLRFPAVPGPYRASTLRLHPEQEIQVALGTFDAAFPFSAKGAGHTPKKRSRGQVRNRLPTGRTSALLRRELHIQEVLRRNLQYRHTPKGATSSIR